MVPWVAVETTSIEPRSPPTRRRTIQSPSPSPGKVAEVHILYRNTYKTPAGMVDSTHHVAYLVIPALIER